MSEVTLFLTLDPDEAGDPAEIERRVRELEGVESATARVEEPERAGEVMQGLMEVTLVITATGGLAANARKLLDELAGVVTSARGLKRALVDTPDGPQPLESTESEGQGPR